MSNSFRHIPRLSSVLPFLLSWVIVFTKWLMICVSPAAALDSRKAITQYVHDLWQTNEGLPMNSIRGITQTNDGYLWVITGEGLAKFDGVRFTVFDKRNTPEILINQMISLYVDRSGNLWIGTNGGGLIRYSGGNFQTYSTKNGLSENVILSITGDHENVWIGTTGSGLNRLHNGQIQRFTREHGLAGNRIECLFFDRNGHLWIGTDSGLSVLHNGKFKSYSVSDGLPNNHIVAISQDKSGTVWIGTRQGLTSFQNEKFKGYSVRDGLSDDEIRCLFTDHDGNVWIGTGKGLNRFANDHFDSYTVAEGLSHNHVISLFEDREGSLWIGTRGGGLNRLKDAVFSSISSEEGISDDFVWSVYQDANHDLWIGTETYGLNRLRNNTVTTYTIHNGLSHNTIYSLTGDRFGALWIGTLGGGVNRMKDDRIKIYTKAQGLSNPFVRSLFVDRNDVVWIGTQNGLNALHNEEIKSYSMKDGLSSNYVISIIEDHSGTLWIGTLGGGLNRFRDGIFSSYGSKDGMSNDVVSCIYPDQQGDLWIGTRSGLNRFREGKFEIFTARDGLFNDTIFQIVEDGDGRFWMSSINGIFYVRKQDLNDFASHKISKIPSVFFSTSDGLKSTECNAGKPAIWKSHNGKLWFATMKGVASIDPKQIKINRIPPPVQIERVLVDDKLLSSIGSGIPTAPPGSEKLEFQYTALSLLSPKRVQFEYMLEGYDTNWVKAANRRTAYYTHIPPGNYNFKIVASNNDGIWNREGASFPFYIKPHFYQTLWFYSLCSIAAILFSFTIYRMRLNQMKSRFAAVLAERMRIARDFHDTVAQSLTGVVSQLDAADSIFQKQPEKSKHYFLRARELAAGSLEEARQTLWHLRNEPSNSSGIVGSLQQLVAKTESTAQLKFDVHGLQVPLKTEIEENVFRIAQEALNNAMKYSKAEWIRIDLSFERHALQLKVEDNGSGFTQDPLAFSQTNHFGLKGMQERAAQLGGSLEVQSKPGKGTTISVSIPK